MEFVPFDPEKSLSKPSIGGRPRALLMYISSFINTRIGIDFQRNQTGNRPHIQNKEYQPAGADFWDNPWEVTSFAKPATCATL